MSSIAVTVLPAITCCQVHNSINEIYINSPTEYAYAYKCHSMKALSWSLFVGKTVYAHPYDIQALAAEQGIVEKKIQSSLRKCM